MDYTLDKGAHSVYALQYHFVQCIKYRKPALSDVNVCDYLKIKIKEISKTFGVDVLNIECDVDHYHMIFKSKPTLNIPKYINAIKTITSREIKRNFPDIKKYIWGNSFWSRSYFLTTTGQVTLEMLKKYVDGQKEKYAAHKQD